MELLVSFFFVNSGKPLVADSSVIVSLWEFYIRPSPSNIQEKKLMLAIKLDSLSDIKWLLGPTKDNKSKIFTLCAQLSGPFWLSTKKVN